MRGVHSLTVKGVRLKPKGFISWKPQLFWKQTRRVAVLGSMRPAGAVRLVPSGQVYKQIFEAEVKAKRGAKAERGNSRWSGVWWLLKPCPQSRGQLHRLRFLFV